MGGLENAIYGLVGVVVASVLAYVFWMREWAIQREASEQQERRRIQLALAEKVLQIVTRLIHVMLVDPKRPPEERDGLKAELKAIAGPLQKYFSPTAMDQLRRFSEALELGTGDASKKMTFEEYAHRLIDALYGETFPAK